jgi:plasmid maintenance system antidote protein VapI
MHNPAQPGRVLQEYLEGMNITHVARHLHVSRVTLSKIFNCRAGIWSGDVVALVGSFGNASQLLVRYAIVVRTCASEAQEDPEN